MNEYFIFCIKEKFAKYFFHNNDRFYEFFKSFMEHHDNIDLFNQFHEITIEYPKNLLIAHLKTKHTRNIRLMINNDQSIILASQKQSITLHLFDKYIKCYSQSLYNADKLLFSRLRLFHPYLFVMCQQTNKYGWITPKLMNDHLNTKQLLSS